MKNHECHDHCVPRIRNALSQIRNNFHGIRNTSCLGFCISSCRTVDLVRITWILRSGTLLADPYSVPDPFQTKKTFDLDVHKTWWIMKELTFIYQSTLRWKRFIYFLREDQEHEPNPDRKWEPDPIPEQIMDPVFISNNPNFRLKEQRRNPEPLTGG